MTETNYIFHKGDTVVYFPYGIGIDVKTRSSRMGILGIYWGFDQDFTFMLSKYMKQWVHHSVREEYLYGALSVRMVLTEKSLYE